MILVDAHVHIYDCFDLTTFLDSAFINFKSKAAWQGQANHFSGFLLLAETAGDNWFQRLVSWADERRRIESKSFGKWTLHRTNENSSLWARSNGDHGIYLISGRQVVTAEKLEVLALITDRVYEDGRPLKEVIENIRSTGGIPVIPWGFGKWTGKRGSILSQMLEKVEDSEIFLGDNGGRPVFWPRPSHFRKAQAKGLRILPGSDPLPLDYEVRRVGGFGFWCSGDVDPERPAAGLKQVIFDNLIPLQVFGKRERPVRFFQNQWKIKMSKRTRE